LRNLKVNASTKANAADIKSGAADLWR